MRQPAQPAYIVEAARSAIGRGHPEKGGLRSVHPAVLLGHVMRRTIERAGLDPARIDNVIGGCAHQVGEQSAGIIRSSWLTAGLPYTTGATTVDVRCGSGQQAVNFGALTIEAGLNGIVMTGGVEHMGRVGFRASDGAQALFGKAFPPELHALYPLTSQGVSAEVIADHYGFDRDGMDAFATQSHARADAASKAGDFRREIVSVPVEGGSFDTDQGIRPGTSPGTLAGLEAVFRDNGRITAGNSSQISDGAAAVLLASGAAADDAGLRKRAIIVDQVTLGVDPVTMLTGPIPATRAILERNGLTMKDIGYAEVNEAFAPVPMAWLKDLDADPERLNIRGGAIALGHPLGCTGARLLTTLLHVLEDKDAELGLVAMCCGGGIGTATLIKRV